MVSPFEGKTELFQKKVTKKGPKTGSGGIVPVGTISQFFRDFPGFLKIQVEKSRAGKRCVDGAYALRKNRKKNPYNIGQTDTSSWNPGVAEKEAPSAQ